MSKLTTENLELRVRNLEDADALFALYSDKDVAKYVGGVVGDRDTVVKSIFTSDSHWRKNGFGLWSAYSIVKKEFVGTVGLRRMPDTQVELVVHLAKKHWKKGLATEACTAVLDFGFRIYKLKKVVALIDRDNTASLKLVAKLGFKEVGPSSLPQVALFEKNA